MACKRSAVRFRLAPPSTTFQKQKSTEASLGSGLRIRTGLSPSLCFSALAEVTDHRNVNPPSITITSPVVKLEAPEAR